ncbi:hypothetical protein [Streptomyces goshikiensis]|uniref:hypothetical protein n=1 Tax=Streptomyces goshikiensis TaxID=1942 RepID=UPI00364F02BC
MHRVHLLVGEDIQARCEGEVGGRDTAQGVRAAEPGVGPGVIEGLDGAVDVPLQGLGEVVGGERAASVREGVQGGGRVSFGIWGGGCWAW